MYLRPILVMNDCLVKLGWEVLPVMIDNGNGNGPPSFVTLTNKKLLFKENLSFFFMS